MFYKIAGSILGFGIIGTLLFIQFKLLLLGRDIKRKHGHLIGGGWRMRRQLKKLSQEIDDPMSKKKIADFLWYSNLFFIVVVSGFLLMAMVSFFNTMLSS
jgi:hypothetical protein